jgi:hypothetical protein
VKSGISELLQLTPIWIICGAFLHFFSASKVENGDPDQLSPGQLRFLSFPKAAVEGCYLDCSMVRN